MIRPSPSWMGLLLLIGCAVAGPESERRPRALPSSACQEHTSLHSRLDVVEKKVEDTVEKLEGELSALLDAIEDPKWQRGLENTGRRLDVLDDPPQAIPS